jgi:hypothetical protein
MMVRDADQNRVVKLSHQLEEDTREDASADRIQIRRSDPNGWVEQNLFVSFQRTVRVSDNDTENELPPSLGKFPIFDTEDYKQKLPQEVSGKGGYFIPMYREYIYIQLLFGTNSP